MYDAYIRVVQLMNRPLRGFKQSVPYLVIGVQTCRLDHYTSCGLVNVQEKFHGGTVDVQAPTGFLIIST